MKNIIIAIIACVGVLFSTEANAQSAQSKYMEAFENYESGNYQQTIQGLQEVERQLGNTNVKVLSLKALAYNELQKYREAQLTIERYFHTRPNRNDPGYDEMHSLYQDVKAINEKEYNKKRSAAEQNKARELKESQNETTLQNELYLYQAAKEAHTIEAYKAYLAKASNDSLRKLATTSLSELDNESRYQQKINEAFTSLDENKLSLAISRFNEAKRIKTSAWLDEHIKEAKVALAYQSLESVNDDIIRQKWSDAYKKLQSIRAVINRPEINEKWNLVRESLAFEDALKEDDPKLMRQYLLAYPKGSKRAHAEGYLFNYYLNKADEHLKAKQVAAHYESLAEVKKMDESSYWQDFSTAYYNALGRMGQYLTSGKKSHQVRYINQAVDYYQLYSGSIGTGAVQKLKDLKRKQKTWARPALFHLALKTDDQFNDIGLAMGSANNIKLGFAITGQLPIQVVKDQQTSGDYFKRKELEYIKSMAGFQLNKKIIYPLWVYAGGGWAQLTKITVVPGEPNMGFISDPQVKVHTGSVEAGVNIHLKPFMISAGVVSMPFLNNGQKQNFNMSKTPFHYSLGVGFGFGLK